MTDPRGCKLTIMARLAAAVLGGLLTLPASFAADEPEARRAAMVERIADRGAAGTPGIGAEGISDRVLAAMHAVPRHRFVPAAHRDDAYRSRPLPIGHGQTISQPYVVALMTELAAVEPGDRVLEIGTGSGYQAAVLAELTDRVRSIEIIEPLARRAAERLERLGYAEVATKVGDGYDGWPEHAPYDAIVVTAAARHIPPPLVRQLRPGGRMVVPVGRPFSVQQLTLVEKTPDGEVRTRQLLPVQFVPLTGEH